jgi:regulator of cell morphogenesis and NO signaling
MLLEEKKVGEFVAEDYRTAHLFSKHGIDFCCGGKKSLKEACFNASADANLVITELQKLASEGNQERNASNLEIPELIEHILNTHHVYTREKGELLLLYSTKMLNAHGERHPEEIPKFYELVQALIADLMPHLLKEEKVLFPAIISIVKGEELPFPPEHIEHPIYAMETEHESVGKILHSLKIHTNNFTPPAYACTTWKICYSTLAAYAEDLQIHIHLENNVLFPKLIKLLEKI